MYRNTLKNILFQIIKLNMYVRGGQSCFGHDLLKIYFNFEDRLP